MFSRGRLVLPHVRGRLAVQSTRASLCVGLWSSQGLVKDDDIKTSLGSDDIVEEDEPAMDWDVIHDPHVVASLRQNVTNSMVFANNSCALCTASLQVAQFLSLAAPDQGPAFFVFLCQQFKLSSTCNTTFGATTLGPVLTQVLANADVTGYDGQVTSFVFKLRPGTPSRFSCPQFLG